MFGPLGNLLGATSTATIATGILNVWMHTPDETAPQHAALTATHGPRFLCGIGISHRPFIDHVNTPGTYQNPVETMASYLDGLDAADAAARRGRPCARRTRAEDARAGPHPHRRHASRTSSRPSSRRRRGRASAPTASSPASRASCSTPIPTGRGPPPASTCRRISALPNYSNNWKRQGFTDDDLADGGSDRLVDALVVWGDEATIAARVQEHRDAGADHVCIQVLTDDPAGSPDRTVAGTGACAHRLRSVPAIRRPPCRGGRIEVTQSGTTAPESIEATSVDATEPLSSPTDGRGSSPPARDTR